MAHFRVLCFSILVACDGGSYGPKDIGDGGGDTDTDTDTGGPPPTVDDDDDGFAADVDCDDGDPTVFPGAPDVCGDDRVTDCDRSSDDGRVTVAGVATFEDLGEALLAAAPGDDVRVCAGTWVGPFVAATPVQLVSHAGRDLTVLSGDQRGTALEMAAGGSVAGFTIRDGVTRGRGGGILGADLVVEDCLVTHNRAEEGAGIALAEAGGTLSALNSEIRENVADWAGGAIHAGAAAALDLTGSVLEANTAASQGAGIQLGSGTILGGILRGNATVGVMAYEGLGSGGGIHSAGDLTLVGTELDGNSALYGAGLLAGVGEVVLLDVRIHGNLAVGAGGGIYALDADLALSGLTEVYENEAGAGAGIDQRGGSTVGGVVRDNEAAYIGGGVRVADGRVEGVLVSGNAASDGGGIFAEPGTEIAGCTITANEGHRLGGGIHVPPLQIIVEDRSVFFEAEPVTVTDTVLSANIAEDGGGIYAANELFVDRGELADNLADRIGAGLRLDDDGQATLTDVSVSRNIAGTSGGGASVDGEAVLVSVLSSWGTDADDNLPDDVFSGETAVSGYGRGASFTCAEGACDPAP